MFTTLVLLWLSFIFKSALCGWQDGDLMILVNFGYKDDHVLEFNTDDAWPQNPHPVFMVALPGAIDLRNRQNKDYWYFKNNTDNTWRIHSAYNNQALEVDSVSQRGIIVAPVATSTSQYFFITEVQIGQYKIESAWLNKYSSLNRHLGLRDGGWPEMVDSTNNPTFGIWYFTPASTTVRPRIFTFQTTTLTREALTSTVYKSDGKFTSTIESTTTSIIMLTSTQTVNTLAKRYLIPTRTITSTDLTITTTYVDAPISYVTISGGVYTSIITKYVTSTTVTQVQRSTSGTRPSVSSADRGSVTSAAIGLASELYRPMTSLLLTVFVMVTVLVLV